MTAMTAAIGKFEVLARISRGGMADIYRCRVRGIGGFDKTVAVKRIRVERASDPDFVRMFLDEARLAARLNHPNVVQVFEIGEVGGDPYIAMEYVDGPTLAQVVRRARQAGQLHDGHLVKVIADVAAGLHHAHTAVGADGEPLGLVHRDVSPQNILVSREGVPKLLDFGVAKANGRLAETQAGTLKGKLRYMAPEQLQGTVDARTDVFALGVCLFEATTGRLPYGTEQADELTLLRHIAGGGYFRPSLLRPDYPRLLEEIVMWAIEPDPARRCPSAWELHECLEEAAATAGPLASSARGVRAWVRRVCPADPPGRPAMAVTRAESLATPLEQVTAFPPATSDAPSALPLPATSEAFTQPARPAPPRRAPRMRRAALLLLPAAVLVIVVAVLAMARRPASRTVLAVGGREGQGPATEKQPPPIAREGQGPATEEPPIAREGHGPGVGEGAPPIDRRAQPGPARTPDLVVPAPPPAGRPEGSPRVGRRDPAAGVPPALVAAIPHAARSDPPSHASRRRRVALVPPALGVAGNLDASAPIALPAPEPDAPATAAGRIFSARPQAKVPPPRLPRVYRPRGAEDLARVLSLIEAETVQAGCSPPFARGITDDLRARLAPRPAAEIYPAAAYYFIVREAALGRERSAAAQELARAHSSGIVRALERLPVDPQSRL